MFKTHVRSLILSLVTCILSVTSVMAQTVTFPQTVVIGTSQAARCPNILDYGGDATGTVDNSVAFAATAAVNVSTPCVFFPPGIFKFSSSVSYTFPSASQVSLSIIGSGQDTTELYWPSGGGLNINWLSHLNSTQISGMTFKAGIAHAGTALTFSRTTGAAGTSADPPSTIENVTFGSLSTGGPAWDTMVKETSIVAVDFVNDWYSGDLNYSVGVDLEGTSGLPSPVHNFSGNGFYCLNKGIIYGTYVQGVTVSGGSNFTCGNIGIWMPSTDTGMDQLTVSGSQFEVAQHAIYDQVGLPALTVNNNLFITDTSGSDGINGCGAQVAISGNQFQAGTASGYGIRCFGAGVGSISGNVFVSQGTNVYLGISTSGFLVSATNRSLNTLTTSVVDLGTNNSVEGTFGWIPTVVGDTTPGSPSYTSVRTGTYSKSNNVITITFNVGWTGLGGASGSFGIEGIPVAATGSLYDFGQCVITAAEGIQLDSGYYAVSGLIESGEVPFIYNDRVSLFESSPTDSNPVTTINITHFPGAGQVTGACTYHILSSGWP